MHEKIDTILLRYPFAETFLTNNGIDVSKFRDSSMDDYFKSLSFEHIEDHAIDPEHLLQQLAEFIKQMLSFLGEDNKVFETVTILPGHDKSGKDEDFTEFVVRKNEIVSIVGPTGSGNSRLLKDVEWAAQNDTAILSKSPIILIDEIKNAGIDRKKALKLMLAEEKIVLMATHDPVLALMGDRRIVIKNGGIHKVIDTTEEEKEILTEIEELDRKVQTMREKLRKGWRRIKPALS